MSVRHWLAVGAALALAACSSDTAIVLQIHGSEGALPTTTRLNVYLGAGAIAPLYSDENIPALWWQRAIVDPQQITLDEPLGDRTYQFLLSPTGGLALDSEIVFAVVASVPDGDQRDRTIGFAHADDYLRFADGEVRRIDVPLEIYDPGAKAAGVLDSGCVWWNADERIGPPERGLRDRAIVPITDLDCDGFATDQPMGCGLPGDCNDGNAGISPARNQNCTTVDTDCCPDTVADTTDADLDGFSVCGGDCVDSGFETDMFGVPVAAARIHPEQVDETCNGVDEACARDHDGGCDEGVDDPDGDGYVNCTGAPDVQRAVRVSTCERYNLPECLETGTANGVEARDIHPGADDRACDGVDQDCNGACDDGDGTDEDHDGFPRCANTGAVDRDADVPVCAPAEADCDDDEEFAQPGATELCDGIDSACDQHFASDQHACLPADGMTDCRLGTATCMEQLGMAGYGQCVPGNGAPLPPAFCRGCSTNDDALTCDDGRFRTCEIHAGLSDPTLACTTPVQETPPTIGFFICPGGCTWTVVSGLETNGWRVSIGAPLAASPTPAAVFMGTEASLRVLTLGARGQAFVIRRESGSTITHEAIFLRREATTCAPVRCGGGPG